MGTNKLAVLVGSLAVLALPVGVLRAQRDPGRGGPGGGFGWGGVHVLDARAGACVFDERGKSASTDYALILSETRAVLPPFTPPTLPTHTVIRTGGVTYMDTTVNSKTMVCINDPANHVRYFVSLTNTAPPTGTALEIKLESGPHRDHQGQHPQDGGDASQPPAWNGKANPNLMRYTITSLGDFMTDGVPPPAGSAFTSWTTPAGDPPCTTLTLTVFKHGQTQDGRVTCSPLGISVYSLINNPYANSTVTATFTTASPLITLPLSNYSGITVKVFNGGTGNRRPHGGGSGGSSGGA